MVDQHVDIPRHGAERDHRMMLTSNAGGSSTVVTTGYSTFALQHAVSQWRIAVLLVGLDNG